MQTTLEENTLVINPVEYGIDKSKANEIIGNLPQIQSERAILEDQYAEIIKMDIDNPDTSKKARELRLLIRDNRTKGINVWHSTTKEFFLKGGQFVDAIKRKEIAVNERMEANLETIEKHSENLEKERKAKLNADRVSQLEPYNAFVPMGLNFGEISEEEFTKILNGSKLQFEQQQKEEAKAEEKRIAEAKAEAERIENQRIENERLKAEADKREKEIEAERKKQADILAKQRAEADKIAKAEAEKQAQIQAEKDAELKRERDAKAKLEAELQAKKDAEAKAERERIAEEEKQKKETAKLAKAPIKKQLNAWVNSFEIPTTTIENEKSELIKAKFEAFKKWSLSEIESM